MIERKFISNCDLDVNINLDISGDNIQNAIQKNNLRLKCPKTTQIVNLDIENLFGYPLQIFCLKTDCPYNSSNNRC